MKLALTTLGLVACLVAAPMVAQDTSATSSSTATTSASGDTMNDDASASSQTLTGTVVSVTGDSLVIRTAEGEKTLSLASLSSRPGDLEAGKSITVTYSESNGEMVASNITVDSAAADTMADTTADATADTAADTSSSSTYVQQNTYTPPATDTSAAVDDTDVDTDVSADVDADGDTDVAAGVDTDADALPATASEVPLLALLGALAMGAALIVRRAS